MRARVRVVRDVGFQDRAQPSGVEHDHVIEALAARRADEPLDVGVLSRRARRSPDVLNAHGRCRGRHRLKGEISVVNEIARRLIPRKSFAELLRGPGRRWMRRHGDMNDSAALVREDHQHEEQSASRGRNDEEIGCTPC